MCIYIMQASISSRTQRITDCRWTPKRRATSAWLTPCCNSLAAAIRRRSKPSKFRFTPAGLPILLSYHMYLYYASLNSSAIRLAVSLPIRGKRIDLSQRGLFYYPIGIKTAFTGSAVSVNAPFQMDADRTKLIDSEWNRWLASEAADLTSELLIHHWLDRFGSDAYLSVLRYTDANPPWFAEEIQSHLKTVACWPTRMRDGSATILRKAEEIIVPIDPVLDGFLEDDKYLDPRIASVEKLRNNLVEFGALRFGLNSLVRLRSAGSDEKALATKVATSEANYHFTNYQTALSEPNQQVRMAAALTKLSRQLSNQNRKDLKETRSTLAADGSLQRAADLLLVNRAIWDVCPVPLSRRLDRKLLDFKAIANLCDPFQVGDWVRQVAERARLGTILEEEHQALYQYLLDSGLDLYFPRVPPNGVQKDSGSDRCRVRPLNGVISRLQMHNAEKTKRS